VTINLTNPLTGICLTGFLARASYSLARTPVLALFALSFGVGPEAVGFAVAISTVTGIFFKMPSGVISDVIGKKRTLIAGLCVFAFVPLAYLFINNYETLVIVRFFHGFATAIYGPVAMAVVVEVSGDKKAEMLSWFSSVTIIGNLIGAPLGGFLVTWLSKGQQPTLFHFKIIYLIVAVFGILSLVIMLIAMKNSSDPKLQKGRTLKDIFAKFSTGVREILLNKKVLFTSNMEGVQNLSVGALEAFLPIYTVVVCGFSAFHAGILWGAQIGVTILTKPLMGRYSDKYGRHGLLFWGMFLCAIPFLLIPWFREFWILIILSAIFGFGEAIVTSSAAALVADYCSKENLGSAMGTFGTIFDVGHATGPILAGFLIGLTGNSSDFRLSFAVISMILIIAAISFRIMVMKNFFFYRH
jgi:MFS family permease